MIRTATTSDVARLVALHRASILQLCSAHYSSEQLAAWTAVLRPEGYVALLSSHVVVVDERAGKLCGFGVLEPASGLINATYVEPTAVRQGVGAALLGALEQSARAHGSAVVQLNATLNAVAFYERLGYTADGAALNRLPSGVELPCIQMHKRLHGP